VLSASTTDGKYCNISFLYGQWQFHAWDGWAQAPQIVARPPNLAILLTHCGQLILKKISKFHAIRCQILRLKCIKFDFRWGSAPDPAWGAYSTPPDPLAIFKGPTSKGRAGGETRGEGEGKGEKRESEGGSKGGEGREGGGQAPEYLA